MIIRIILGLFEVATCCLFMFTLGVWWILT